MIVMNAVPLNGSIYALNADDGSVAWTGNASDEYLRILNPNHSPTLPSAPLLILLSRKLRRPGSGGLGSEYATRILDVHNGDVLYEANRLGSALSWHALKFDGEKRFAVNFDRRAIEFDFSPTETEP